MAAGDVTTGDLTTGGVTAGDVTEALAAATGDESLLRAGVTAGTLLEGHLCLDSVDLAALAALLRDRYGPVVDLAGYVAGLDIDEIIGLTVGDVAGYVNRCLLPRP
jgi:acyl carrier protein